MPDDNQESNVTRDEGVRLTPEQNALANVIGETLASQWESNHQLSLDKFADKTSSDSNGLAK